MFRIISDSACDLPQEYIDAHDIEIVPFYLTTDGENYLKDGSEISMDTFYDKIVNEGVMPKSSLPSVQDYVDYILPHVEKGEAVICITISTSLSGSYNSAKVARDQIIDDYPEAKVSVINSTSNTITQGLFVNEAVRMRDAGLSYEETVLRLGKITDSTKIFFTVANLEYLIRNGRIGKMASMITSKIKIRPIIIMKNNEIGLGGISRTRVGSMQMSIEQAKKFIATHNKDDYNWGIGYGYDKEEGMEFAKQAAEELGVTFLPEHVLKIGSVTICHTGPHPIGVGCVQKFEKIV